MNVENSETEVNRSSEYYAESYDDYLDSEEDESVLNLQLNFEKFLQDLKMSLSKCKYRKVLDDIQQKEPLFKEEGANGLILNYWKLNELKIKSMFKIVFKKLLKYETMNINTRVKNIESWLLKIDSELKIIMAYYLNPDPDHDSNNEELIEIIVQLLLENYYLFALFCKHEKLIPDCTALLALCERLIKQYIEISNDPHTLNIAQKVLLFLSSLLIADSDYETAKSYQSRILNYAFRELYIRSEEEGICFDSISNHEQYYLNKTFTNIVLAFYHRGVCEENLENIVKAIEAYKQSKWFSMRFIKSEIPELAQFIFDVEKRAMNYHLLIKSAHEKEAEFIKMKKLKKGIADIAMNSGHNTKGKHFKTYSYNDENIISSPKLEHAKNVVEKLKMPPELEYSLNSPSYKKEKKSENIKHILSEVNLVDNLLSDDFKDIVKDFKKIEVFKLDKELQEKLQKRLNLIRVEKTYQEKREFLENSSQGCHINEKLSNSQSMITLNTQNQTKTNSPLKRHKKTATSIFRKSTTTFNTGCRISSASPSMKYQPEVIEKINYDNYIFSKRFNEKIGILDKISKKEIAFQKKLLYLKKYEKNANEVKDIKQVKQEASNYFHRIMSARLSNGMNFNRDENQDNKNNQSNKKKDVKQIIKDQKEKLTNRAVMSLDSRRLSKLTKFIKKEESQNKIELREEFMEKYIEQNKKVLSSQKLVRKRNEEAIKKIDQEIMVLDKRTLNNMRELSRVSIHSKTPKNKFRMSKGKLTENLYKIDNFITMSPPSVTHHYTTSFKLISHNNLLNNLN
jgi:hypothetical protein